MNGIKFKDCIFCNNVGTINICTNSERNQLTTKDNMVALFGYQVESHLRADDYLCNTCKHIIDTLYMLKQLFLPFIIRSNGKTATKPEDLSKLWNVLSNISLDDHSDLFLYNPPSPDLSLVECRDVAAYDEVFEEKRAQIEYDRCHINVDNEVSAITRRRRKKRSTHYTHRKKSRYSSCSVSTRSTVHTPAPSDRTGGNLSILTINSRPASRSSHDSGEFVYFHAVSPKSRKKATICPDNVLTPPLNMYKCTEQECTYSCLDIKSMSQHKQFEHFQNPIFECELCHFKFTEQNDLNIHMGSHGYDFLCPICKLEYRTPSELLEHWQVHVKNSVACNLCQKKYRNKSVLREHKKRAHQRTKTKRIDYKVVDKEEEEPLSEIQKKSAVEYQVRILCQDNTYKFD